MLARNNAKRAHKNFDGAGFYADAKKETPTQRSKHIYYFYIYFHVSLRRLSTEFNAHHHYLALFIHPPNATHHSLSAYKINGYSRYGEWNSQSDLHDNNGV